MENGVENPLKRWTKRSSAAVADDILAPRILLVPTDDSRSPAQKAGRSRAFLRLCPGSLGKLKDRMRLPLYLCPAWRLLSLGGAAIIRAAIIRGVAYERVCVLEACRRRNSGRLSQPRRRRRGKGALRRRAQRNSGKARQHHCIWPLEGGGPGMGGNGEAFRILYRSTDPSGRPIPVSGAIYIPNGPAPAGGRNIISWAHPTSGVVPPCAPSLMPDVGGMMWNLGNMIAEGYIVVATDYPGLGTDGIHPYLIGESEARSVLNSVRAAREMPNTGASNRFAVWGHSQGGHAALFTGEVAARYAPDLKLVGVAAAAPATYLIQLFDADAPTATGKDLTSMTLLSWSRLA